MIESAKKVENQSKSNVSFVFGDHEYSPGDPATISDSNKWQAFIEHPVTSWSPEAVKVMSEHESSSILCIDGLTNDSAVFGNDLSIERSDFRQMLFAILPLIPNRDEVDVVLADQASTYFFPNLSPEAYKATVDTLVNSMNAEGLKANLKDIGAEVAIFFMLTTLAVDVISYLKDRSQPKMDISRRTLLKMMGILAIGSTLRAGSSMLGEKLENSNGLSLAENSNSLALKLSRILYPHFNHRPLVDGRTALMYAATKKYSEELGQESTILLGSDHLKFADTIMQDRQFRVDKIRELHSSLVEVIMKIGELLNTPVTATEASKIAKKRMTSIKVASIKKPKLSQAAEAFDSPEKFVSLKDLGPIDEVQEALGLVS